MASASLTGAERRVNRLVVLATYRHLLRATGLAFKGDTNTLLAARQFARQEFQNKKKVEVGGLEATQGVEHAQGVTKILRENVVQGKHMGEEKYKLNMHEHTQRLDNDTAGNLKGTTKTFKDIKSQTF